MATKLFNCVSPLIALAALAANAHACMGESPFVIEDIKSADVVFIGDVIRYSVEGCDLDDPRRLLCYALIDVDVSETLLGEERKNWTLYWWNTTFGVPDDWEYQSPLIIAGRWNESRGLPLRGVSATIYASKRPDLLQVLQAPCSQPFFLAADQETVAEVRSLIAEKPAAETDQ